MRRKFVTLMLAAVLSCSMLFAGCQTSNGNGPESNLSASSEAVIEEVKNAVSNIPQTQPSKEDTSFAPPINVSDDVYAFVNMPPYTGNATDEVNENIPYFTESDLTTKPFISLSEHDSLGRCGQAYMCASADTMPTEKRGEIGHVKPSGWNQEKYPDVIEESPSYLYNRAHLLMHALSGLNNDNRNLITGTRYFNITAMLPYEEEVCRYVEDTGEHVLYRVTPVYNGNDLVARGVVMEAKSVESDGLQFCVFAHNVQPGIEINYADGSSKRDSDSSDTDVKTETTAYIGNRNSKVFHTSDCDSVSKMSDSNKESFASREDAVSEGYKPCARCNP